MNYEELYNWFVNHVKTQRNKIVNHKGKHTAAERQLQNSLTCFAEFTGTELSELEEATDKNKFYAPGELV